MRNLIILFFILCFLTLSCDNTATNPCTSNKDCGDNKICFNGACYDNNDKIFGKKVIEILNKADYHVVSGGELKLDAKIMVVPTEEMKKIYKDNKEDILDFIKPVEGQDIRFKILQSDVESKFANKNNFSGKSNENGIVEAFLDLKNTRGNVVDFDVEVSSESCESKKISIKLFPQERRLQVIEPNINLKIEIPERTRRTLIAKLETHPIDNVNEWVPVIGDRVKFEIKNPNSTNFIHNSTVSSTVTLNTNQLGLAEIDFKANKYFQGHSNIYNIELSSYNAQKVSFDVKILEREESVCTQNEQCAYLGESYYCEDGNCIYRRANANPICGENECEKSSQCPKGYSCNEGKCIQGCNTKSDCDNISECLNNRCLENCCTSDFNCSENYTCLQNKCIKKCEVTNDCYINGEIENGMDCYDGICILRGRECKKNKNCQSREPEKCERNGKNICFCQAGYCIDPCSDNTLIELSGGSGNDCDNCNEGEICFEGMGINKCIKAWEAIYKLDLIRSFPDSLETSINTLKRLLVPLSDILNGNIEIEGLPSELLPLVDRLIISVVDRYLPLWVQNLVTRLDDAIKRLEKVEVKVDMAFVHDADNHEYIKGYESWKKLYIKWDCSWIELKSQEALVKAYSNFTGNISCKNEEEHASHILNIDEHEVDFYLGNFTRAFLNNILIPSVSNGKAYNFREVLNSYINCQEISKNVVSSINDILGAWFTQNISDNALVSLCENNKQNLIKQMDEELNKLNYEKESTSKFKFSGIAKVEQEDYVAKKLINGNFTGILKVVEEKPFSVSWEASKK